MTGPGVGAVLAYGVVAVLLLSVSPLPAGAVLPGVPLLAVLGCPRSRTVPRRRHTVNGAGDGATPGPGPPRPPARPAPASRRAGS
ncbi:hypothetical protein SLV14_002400 [Streptomyces sp. Je 1-4]|uniref:hypothetical protein n=1 Tax=Streptomyces TaxID=1883 RepID=UPI0021DAC5A3|nr:MULTISPECIES: hypothetical protein [unclassified Streptomyces]UYB39853.1 hypothetical protein SLV14_002400 [Streptomyces sp. Je 1-4]UZQ35913.1 hypothetical protein SLV14N_002400 [Streptomyces sp. Je 1-4] [Streptomyces sp. Je 1-4 4N24]UZQ43331.1 hypothetical protein SLV14NA_002400 [Streptomyces sp. Je 1-4] [Streptomyces sp. Je 1-4 4N24_ara]